MKALPPDSFQNWGDFYRKHGAKYLMFGLRPGGPFWLRQLFPRRWIVLVVRDNRNLKERRS